MSWGGSGGTRPAWPAGRRHGAEASQRACRIGPHRTHTNKRAASFRISSGLPRGRRLGERLGDDRRRRELEEHQRQPAERAGRDDHVRPAQRSAVRGDRLRRLLPEERAEELEASRSGPAGDFRARREAHRRRTDALRGDLRPLRLEGTTPVLAVGVARKWRRRLVPSPWSRRCPARSAFLSRRAGQRLRTRADRRSPGSRSKTGSCQARRRPPA